MPSSYVKSFKLFFFLAYERELSECSTPLLGVRIVTDDRLVPRGIHGWYQEP